MVISMDGVDNDHNMELKTIYIKFIDQFGHINGVFRVLKDFMYLWDENIWESIFNIHRNWKNPLNTMENFNKSVPESLVLIQVIMNDIQPGKLMDFYSVDYDTFRKLHIFIEKLYVLHLGRNLGEDDLWALHKSDILERVLGGLDMFNAFKGSLFLGDEFFQRLKGVDWHRNALIFFKKFHNLLISFLFEYPGEMETTFKLELEKVLVLLAHCSVVLSDSQYIGYADVLRAYNALFKILNTDITDMVDKRYYTGLLLCGDCNELYPLLEDEAPFDFASCSCGGELKYVSMVESVTIDKNI
jgi:hypothetical protein